VRARRLAGGAPGEALPHVNYYGAWVNLHAAEIAGLLGIPSTTKETAGRSKAGIAHFK